jgi:hypothetical protein
LADPHGVNPFLSVRFPVGKTSKLCRRALRWWFEVCLAMKHCRDEKHDNNRGHPPEHPEKDAHAVLGPRLRAVQDGLPRLHAMAAPQARNTDADAPKDAREPTPSTHSAMKVLRAALGAAKFVVIHD